MYNDCSCLLISSVWPKYTEYGYHGQPISKRNTVAVLLEHWIVLSVFLKTAKTD